MKTTTKTPIAITNKITLAVSAAIILTLIVLPSILAQPLLTGVFYDPEGVDTGYEWIEMYNPDAYAINLSSFQIAKGNGATPNDWTNLPALSGIIEPQSFFLIGESNVSAADLDLKLALYNGPDSIALFQNNETVDVLGYGSGLKDEAYYDGTPAADVASGKALSRIFTIDESGVFHFSMTGNNSADWASSDPHPRNRLFAYHPPVQDNATVILTVPLQPLEIINGSLSDDLPIRDGIQWSLIDRKAISLQIRDESASLTDALPQIRYELTQNFASRLLEPQFSHINFVGNATVVYDDMLVLPTDLAPGAYSFRVDVTVNQTQTISKTWQVDILPTLGFDLCESLELVPAGHGTYSGTCLCNNTGNVAANIAFNLAFKNNISLATQVVINDTQVPLEQAQLSFAPGEVQSIKFIANSTSWLHFGTYEGLLTADAWSTD